ncbi:MAG: peptidylprolyl isomerase [Gammaproteobacteria bacterium]|nr:peptidylprolyl isomerase [Gammaproteobacteria bacterium]
MRVAANTVVYFHYTLRNGAGAVLDQSGDAPFGYLHGHGNIVSGLESALEGREAGEALDVQVEPGQGYGERDEALVQAVPRSAFEGVDVEIEAGMRFRAHSDAGPRIVTITEVADEVITVDGNHPLAGEVLHFAVQLTEIRDATATELEHGHVHDGDGHHH